MYNICGGDKYDLMKFRLTELAFSSGLPSFLGLFYNIAVSIIIIIIIIRYGCLLSQAFLPGTSLEPAVIPTTHASSFKLQYFPYCV